MHFLVWAKVKGLRRYERVVHLNGARRVTDRVQIFQIFDICCVVGTVTGSVGPGV